MAERIEDQNYWTDKLIELRALCVQRDEYIVKAREAGATVTKIAESAGITRQQAHRILAEKNGSKA